MYIYLVQFFVLLNVETTFALGAGNTMDNRGLLRGSGQVIGNVVSAGTISPGNSAGSLTIDGSLTLLPEARLSFDIGGREQGLSYDFLRVTNLLDFSLVDFLGTLSLSLINDFRPTETDTFTLMEFGSAEGLFGKALNGGRLLTLDNLASFRVSYSSNNVQVDDYQSPDTDGDGMTDYDEFLAGTDWLDPKSVLAITSLTRNASGHMVLQFACETDTSYVIEHTPDLRTEVWTTVHVAHADLPCRRHLASGLTTEP